MHSASQFYGKNIYMSNILRVRILLEVLSNVFFSLSHKIVTNKDEREKNTIS